MGSNYNLLPRPAVVFAADGQARLVVRRETTDDLLAPDVGLCMDQEDFAGALGSASRPSRIVEAWWLAARDELVFASTPDERTVAQATDVAAFVFSRQSTRTGPVVRAIRASLDRAASVTFAEPIGLLVDAGADDSRVLVRLLCGCDGHTGSD